MIPLAQRRELSGTRINGSRPGITANLTQLTEKFRVLGFTVRPNDAAYFEVLLGSTPTIVKQASGPADSFYSSAEHSGLIRASEPLYTVPAPALERLKRHERLFYSVTVFADAQRNGAAPAVDASTPDADVPFVTLSSGFRGAAMASILGIPLDRLQRVTDDERLSETYASRGNENWRDSWSGGFGATLSAEEDRAEGEDGYGLDLDAPSTGSAAYDDGFGAPQAVEDVPPSEDPELNVAAYGMEDGEEPAMLEDEEHLTGQAMATDVDNSHDDEDTYSDGFEALEEDSPPRERTTAYGAQSNDSYEEDIAWGESLAVAEEASAAAAAASYPLDLRPPTIDDKLALIRAIAPFESGRDGYAAINADGEFAGRFPRHPATGRYHVGLSYGIIQFTQDSGSLGQLLTMMRQRSPEKFREVFGEHSDALVEITNRPGPPSRTAAGGRSARVQPVGGADIWLEPWVARFRRAAAADLFGTGRQLFQGAQNELAARLYLDPILAFAGNLGLNTDRALAIVFDRSVQMGVGGARRWIIDTVGPAQTPAQRQQALAALGHSDIQSFQRSVPSLRVDEDFGPLSHAALAAALRRLGARSPLPVLTLRQMLEAILRRAEGARWGRRTRQLLESTAFTDTAFEIPVEG